MAFHGRDSVCDHWSKRSGCGENEITIYVVLERKQCKTPENNNPRPTPTRETSCAVHQQHYGRSSLFPRSCLVRTTGCRTTSTYVARCSHVALLCVLLLTARCAAKDMRMTSLVSRMTAGFIGIASWYRSKNVDIWHNKWVDRIRNAAGDLDFG